uniref:Putative histone protein n=1 Tax=Pectinaria gouldii TaxID=260746 RepID=A0A0K1R009_PECGU|nr:putative histone protein [Pectinaria gouldii]
MADAIKSPTKKVAAAAKPKKVSTHPKYSEMVRAAIEALKERGGSSRQAILRYIVLNYKVGEDERVVNQHLKVALRTGVKSEMLKQSKGSGASGSFKLGDAAKKKTAVKPKPKKTAAADKPKKSPKKVKKADGEKKKSSPKKKKADSTTKAVEKAKKPKADKVKKVDKPKKVAKTDKAKPKASKKVKKVAKTKEPKTKAPKAKKVLKTPKKSASKK